MLRSARRRLRRDRVPTGLRCCPGAAKACIGKDEECGIGSDTTLGYLCDPKSHRPCPEGKRRVAGKVGGGPIVDDGRVPMKASSKPGRRRGV